MEENTKVFCSNCENFDDGCFGAFTGCFPEKCNAPQNMLDTYKEKAGKPKEKPEKINKDNNCKWFVMKK